MRYLFRRPSAAVLLGSVNLLVLAAASCAPQRPTYPPVTEDSIEVPDAPPEQLLGLAENASREASEVAERMASGHCGPMVPNELRTHVFTGVKAAEKLLAGAAANDAQREQACRMKLDLLGVAAQRRLIPGSRLEQYVMELRERAPEGDLAAEAAAAWLGFDKLFRGATPAEAAPLLYEFAETYPNSTAGLDLAARFAERLAAAGDRRSAIQCYQFAVSLYGHLPEAESLEDRLAELEQAEQKAAAGAPAKQQVAAAGLARQFGGHRDGYFVVYAEENVKPPRHGGFYFYRYEYEVLQGLPAAAAYVRALPEKWSWRLVSRFPETPQGRAQAFALWKKLLRKKRTGKA